MNRARFALCWTFRVLRSPLGAAAAIYAAAAITFAFFLPPLPRLVAPCQQNTLIGISPDGRRLATRNRIELLCATGLSKEQLDALDREDNMAVMDIASTEGELRLVQRERIADLNLTIWDRDENGGNLFWRQLDDPTFVRRLLRTAYPAASHDRDHNEWTCLVPILISPHGRLVVHPEKLGDGPNSWLVREVDTGRVVLQLSDDIRHLMIGPEEGMLTTVHESSPGGEEVVKRWDIHSGRAAVLATSRALSVSTLLLEDRGRIVSGSIPDPLMIVFRRASPLLSGAGVPDELLASLGMALLSDRVRFRLRDGAEPIKMNDGDDHWRSYLAKSIDGRTIVRYRSTATSEFWTRLVSFAASVGVPLQNPQRTLTVVNTATGATMAELPELGRARNNHPPVNGLPRFAIWSEYNKIAAISLDGTKVAAIGEDGFLRIWDLPPPRPWRLILTLPFIPAAPFLLFAAWRRFRAPNFAAAGV